MEEQKIDEVNESDIKKPKKERKISWNKQKKMHRLYWKVIHQEPRPNIFLWLLEILLVLPFELLRRLLVILRFFIVTSVVVAVVGGVFVFTKVYPLYEEYNFYAEGVASSIDKKDFSINESSVIYDNDNRVLAVIKEDADTEYLRYDDIPEDVVNAFIAVEDRSFWSNDGVDYSGILRVGLRFLKTEGDEVHGASTITQQLVKNVYLSSEVSLERKAKEILIARALTKQFTKRDIMEFYVNDICYANGIYGISGAAKAYFNKDVRELSLSQIAYLCAIPNRPSYYDPYVNPNNAIDRRNKILNDMKECGYITDTEYVKAKTESIKIVKPDTVFNNYETTFAVDCAIKYMMEIGGFEFQYEFEDTDSYNAYHTKYNEEYELTRHKLATGGYDIYTTLNSEVYAQMQEILDTNLSFDDGVDEETGIYKLQGAITVVDNSTGKVVAVVGGRSQETDNKTYSFNRAYQSYRQPGSTFKPIAVYTPALMSGYQPESKVYNISVDAAKEKGTDVQKLKGNQMTLRSAVENSRNGVAWQVFDRITPKYGMGFITDMKFSNICPDDYYNASALGGITYGVTTVEMASAYSTLANHGVFREPTCLKSIKDNTGKEIYVEYDVKEIYSAKAADQMLDILRGVLTKGTAAKLGWGRATKMDAFAKTGTTNNCKDGWLCGATPYYSIAVWIGYDQPKTLNNLYGATYPGKIWKECMISLIDGLEITKFENAEYDSSQGSDVEHTEGYYSYLEGRDDNEVLSSGYTVADYRNDRVIGEGVTDIINQINALDMSSADAYEKLTKLYNQGCGVIDTIYSRKYTNEMQGNLDSAYNAKK